MKFFELQFQQFLVIEEANWLHLEDDLKKEDHVPSDGG